MFRHHTHATLKAPARPGLSFCPVASAGTELGGRPCVGRSVTTRPNPVRCGKSRPLVRVPGGRGAFAIRALSDLCLGCRVEGEVRSGFHAIVLTSSLPSWSNASSSCLLTAPPSAFARSNWAALCHRALRSRSFTAEACRRGHLGPCATCRRLWSGGAE